MSINSEGENNGTELYRQKTSIPFFLIAVALTALAQGLSESVYGNFYKEVYDVTATQRGFIEFPRELPGILAVFLISLMSFMGEIRLAIFAQVLIVVGLVLLGVVTPPFSVMLIFLFVNSVGTHLNMPLKDSIGLNIIGAENTGHKLGIVNGMRTGMGFVAGLIVVLGFRSGIFSFTNKIIHIFLIAAAAYICVMFFMLKIRKIIGDPVITTGKGRFLFRKEYKSYYILAMLQGAHRQISLVFGPWVLIDILLRQADSIAMLTMIGSFLGIFFMPMIGKMTDRFGVKRMLTIEGVLFITVYLLFGFASAGLVSGNLAKTGLPILVFYALFVIDKMAMQLQMLKTLYLRSVALDMSEISPALSTGMAMDHAISIICAFLGGLARTAWGPHVAFFIAAALSLGNIIVAVSLPKTQLGTGRTV